jgi:rubredoxin
MREQNRWKPITSVAILIIVLSVIIAMIPSHQFKDVPDSHGNLTCPVCGWYGHPQPDIDISLTINGRLQYSCPVCGYHFDVDPGLM